MLYCNYYNVILASDSNFSSLTPSVRQIDRQTDIRKYRVDKLVKKHVLQVSKSENNTIIQFLDECNKHRIY